MVYSNINEFKYNQIGAGEVNESTGSVWLSKGVDASSIAVYLGGNRFCIVVNGSFTINRNATKSWDIFHIMTLKYQHVGRQYGIAIKSSTREAFIMDFTWYDTNSADSNKVYLWGNGGTYTDLTAGTQFAFSFVFTPTAWIY